MVFILLSTFILFLSTYNLIQIHHEEQTQKRKRSEGDHRQQKKFKADKKAPAKDIAVSVEPLTIQVCG